MVDQWLLQNILTKNSDSCDNITKNIENNRGTTFFLQYMLVYVLRNKIWIKEIRKNYERLSVKEIIILYHCY